MNKGYLKEIRSHYTCYLICTFRRVQKLMLCYEI